MGRRTFKGAEYLEDEIIDSDAEVEVDPGVPRPYGCGQGYSPANDYEAVIRQGYTPASMKQPGYNYGGYSTNNHHGMCQPASPRRPREPREEPPRPR